MQYNNIYILYNLFNIKMTQIILNLDDDLVNRIDDEVIKQGKNRTSGRRFNRTAYIEYALSEYLKLPSLTRGLIGGVRGDFQKNRK